MGIFKEEMIYMDNLAAKQTRIYEDSVDVGIIATPEIKARMKGIISDLVECLGSKLVWKENKPYVQRMWELVVILENEEPDSYRCRVYNVSYANDTLRNKEFFYIYAENKVMIFDEEERPW